ncbi:MAG: thiol protease/hemagglutinin PrtT [Bacteroidales bacterium]|nr:thiol protease/hemagglutinin PrtT [Bacteroidales bacterium]
MRIKYLFRRLFTLFISTLTLIQPLSSSPVDSITARKAATNFYNWKTKRTVSMEHAQLTYVERIPSQGTGIQMAPANAFYVFDFGEQFVMVSADTRVLPVLAYSTETGFSGDDVPKNLGWFLNQYTQQIEYAIQHLTDTECEANVSAWNQWLSDELPITAPAAVVSPLVQTTWDQPYPYNALCPNDANGPGGHVYTGCVATAMAQLMRYWQYPTTGIGSHSYSANNAANGYGNYGTQSVDFAANTYDYSLMPLSLSSSSPAEQINEVAKLMYHCGVSVDMKYGVNGSSASTYFAAVALNTYFGYSGVTEKYRSDYSDANWIALLKGELNNMRPILYSGSGSGGHAFLCDGYDNSNNFHFNWGWGGYCDGFYALSSLTPGGNNYNYDHAAVIGIDASQSMIQAGIRSMSFISESGTVSSSQSTPILAAHLSTNITATVSGNFKISTDNVNFYTSRMLGSNGGTLYVRYEPTASSGTEHGYVALVSGSVKDTIYLTGTLYDNTPYCLPPENLSISSQDLHNVSLQWNAPVLAEDPHTLSWSTNNVNLFWGSGYNYKISMLQRFSNEDLVPYHNQALTSIQFFADGDATSFTAVVYKGGNFNGGYDPGTLVLSQSISMSSLTLDAWNTVTLNTPIIIDATEELWFGICIEAPGGTYSVPLNLQAMPTKGCIAGMHSGNNASWSEFYDNYSFCISGTVKNIQTLTNYTIFRDDTPLGTTTNTSFTDYLSTTNTYVYKVTANWSNNCSASVQKSFTNVANITATPEALDFFGNHGFGTFVKTVFISGSGLPTTITATVTGNFHISVNGTSFSTSTSLPASGGTLYVKYTPTSNNSEYETGLVTLSSGSLSTTISLSGQSTDECTSPQNLAISQSGNVVNLSWDAATPISSDPATLSWCTSFVNSYLYFGSNLNLAMVQRFETSDLASYHNKKLTSVSFALCDYANITSCKIVVYKGGTFNGNYGSSGSLVCEQVVPTSSLSAYTWITVPLNSPVVIDASQELWFGVYLSTAGTSYSLAFNSNGVVSGKGALYRQNNNNYWWSINDLNFALTGTIEDEPLTLTTYQIDRNSTTLGTTSDTHFDDNVYYNGIYNYDVWAVWSNGCKAPARGSITVSGLCNLSGLTYTQESCNNYIWHGSTYTTSGTYYHSYTDANGCPVFDTLELTIHHGTHNAVTETACESFTWHGQTYTVSGTYTYAYTNADGCPSVDTLHLTVNHLFNTPLTAEICEGGSYHFFGQTLTTAGTYTHTLQSAHGCDSVITLTLTVNPVFNTPLSAEICHGGSYNFFGQTLTTAGTYTHTLQSINGCDSVITLTLTVNPVFNTPLTAEICEGGSYDFFGQQHTTAGTYTHTLQSINGCDSVITLSLTVNPIFNTSLTAEICDGGSYNFFGQTLTIAGTYTHTLQSVHGCDSVITLTLSVNPVFNTSLTAEICEGGSYDFFGQMLTTAGTYTHTLQSVNGCDSVISLTLTVNPIFNTPFTAEICEGSSYNFFGQTLTTAGTYTHTLQSVHGCDSVITLMFSVNPVLNTTLTAEICDGGSYNFFGQTLTTAGTYTHTLQSVHGCDSVISLTLTVNPVFNTPITAEICEGGSYNFLGQTLTTAGTYTHTLQSVHGCDSVITLTISVNPVLNSSLTAEICDGGSYYFFGQTLTSAGTYTHTLQSVYGCDSIITLTLTVNPVFNTSLTTEICEGGSYSFFGQTLTTAGTYTHTLQSVHGCDSVISLTLTINPVFNTPLTAEICNGNSFDFFGQTLTSAGTYTHTLQSVYGCDSVITLTLTVNPVFNTSITAEICEGGSYNFFGQTLTTAGTYTHTLQSVHGCDSVITLTLAVNDVINTPISAEICEGGSYNFFGQTLTTAGTYTHTLQSIHGCDSVITLTLSVNPVFNTPLTAEICDGNSFDFFGQTLTSAGTYTHTLQSVHGCDSVITLTLSVNPVFNTPISAEICEGSSYNFFEQTLTTAGTYTHTLQSAHGCDSVISLTLTVNPVLNTALTAEICEGGSYSFFGQTLTTAGTYTHTLQSVHGCDSVISLTLTVLSADSTDFTGATCDSYTWNGETFTESGDYTRIFTNVNGCDSVVTLHLTISPSFDITIYDTAVRQHEYTLGDFQITPEEVGTFTYDLAGTTEAGCDSTVHLILTVLNNDGIPDIETANVEIFPNPAHALLNIKGENMREIYIYNTDGQIVYSKENIINNLQQVDVSRYSSGQYLVKIIFDTKQSVTKKVVVNCK